MEQDKNPENIWIKDILPKPVTAKTGKTKIKEFQKNLECKNEKKNNSIDKLNDKIRALHMRWLRHNYVEGIWIEKLYS